MSAVERWNELAHGLVEWGTSAALTSALLLVVVTHDINLAARYCSHVLLLHEGRTVASGPPEAVMDRGVLETVYGVELVAMHHDGGGRPWMQPVRPLGGDA